jgi:hypothetical protein
VQWTPNVSGHTFAVYLDDVLQTVTAATSYTFSGLTSRTRHQAAVREICGVGDTAAAVTCYFRTSCTTLVDLPYFEEFDYNERYGDSDGLPPCWDSIGNSSVYFTDYEDGSLTAMIFLSVEAVYTGSFTSYIATPKFNMPAQGVSIRFKGQTGHNNDVTAGIMTDPTDSSTFVPLGTITYNNRGLAWYEYTLEGPDSVSTSGTAVALAFRWPSDGSGGLDSLFVEALPLPIYELAIAVNDSTMGSVTGAGSYEAGTVVTVTATPNEGYRFVTWSDSVTTPTRVIDMTKNIDLTAFFAPDTVWYTVTVNRVCRDCYEEIPDDYVTGEGVYQEGATVTLEGHVGGCQISLDFWIDEAGDTIFDNPYNFVINSDRTLTAVFGAYGGIDDVEGTDFRIYPNPATTTVTIVLDESMDANTSLQVLDQQGRCVFTQALKQSGNQTITIDVSRWAAGTYFVSIVNDSGAIVRKLILR